MAIPYGSILPKLTERKWRSACRRIGVNPKRMDAILRARYLAETTQAILAQSILEQHNKRRQATMARRTANAGATPPAGGASVAAAAGQQAADPFASLGAAVPQTTSAPADPFAGLGAVAQSPPAITMGASPGLDSLAPQVNRDSINAAMGAGPSLGGGSDPAVAAAVQALQQKVDGILSQLAPLNGKIDQLSAQQAAGFGELAKGIGSVLGKVQEWVGAAAASAPTAPSHAPTPAPQTQPVATPGAAPAAPTGGAVDPHAAAKDRIVGLLVPMIQQKYADPAFPRLAVEPQNANVETILGTVLANEGINVAGSVAVAVLKERGYVNAQGVIAV